MIRYVFREAFVAIKNAKDADAQALGEAIAAVAVEGRLQAKDVLEAARAEDSPLHVHFEWNDNVAAEAYRMDQARELIRVIRIEEKDVEEPQRAFLSANDGGTAYFTRAAVQSSTSLQLSVLKAAERDLESFERRYRDLQEICEAVSVAREKVAKRRKEAEARTQ